MGTHTFEVTSVNFAREVEQSALPVLVEFGADWCPPCKMLAPIVDQIAQKHAGALRVGTVDSDAHPDLTTRFFVRGLPTLILFQNGQPVRTIVGYQPREKIEAQIAPVVTQ